MLFFDNVILSGNKAMEMALPTEDTEAKLKRFTVKTVPSMGKQSLYY